MENMMMKKWAIACLTSGAVLATTPAFAKGWPSTAEKVKWPIDFAIAKDPDGANVDAIQSGDDFYCLHTKKFNRHYVYAAKKGKLNWDAAKGLAQGKYEFSATGGDGKKGVTYERGGGAFAFVSFSIRSVSTKAVLRTSKKTHELILELDLPATSISSRGDYVKLCGDARAIMFAGN